MQDYVNFVYDCIYDIFGPFTGTLLFDIFGQVIFSVSVGCLVAIPFLVFRKIILMLFER